MILPEAKGALEIAILVRLMSNLHDAAALIDQYAQTVASGAKLDATQDAYDRMDALLQKAMAPYVSPAEYDEKQALVAQEMSR